MSSTLRSCACGAAVAVLLVCGGASARQALVARPFAVSLVRDGESGPALEIVARFTGAEWVHTWQKPDDDGVPVPPLDAIPEAWLGAPVPRQWTAWSDAGATMRVRVTGTRRADACAGPVLLTIAAPGASSALAAFHVAVDTAQVVERLHRSAPADRDWTQIEPVVLGAFRANERAARDAAGPNSRAAHRLSDAALAGQPISIDFMVRSTDPAGSPVYYFEATRRVKGRPDDGLSVSGWIRRGAARQWVVSGAEGRVLLDDSNPVPALEPIAAFRLGTRVYWVVKWNGYEGWSTAIVEITATGARDVLVTPGGGC